MHELSLMQSIIQIVTGELKDQGFERVEVIRLKVGELAQIEESSMQFAFDVLKEGTKLEQAKLELLYIPGEAYCSQCNFRYQMQGYRVTCPECGGGGQIVAGKELFVDSMEVVDDEGD